MHPINTVANLIERNPPQPKPHHAQKGRNEEFCEPRRTGAHLAEGTAKDTGRVRTTISQAVARFPEAEGTAKDTGRVRATI